MSHGIHDSILGGRNIPVIRIKPETYERMKSWAIPLEHTPNDAIERILDAAEEHRTCQAGAPARNREAAEAEAMEQDPKDASTSSPE